MTRLFVLFCALLVTGCAPSPVPVTKEMFQGESQLYQIRLSRWSEPRFSGLLALRTSDAGFYYALLDATGVTLLAARVSDGGDHHLLKAYGPFAESSLPGLLSQALFRVLIAQPAELPCNRHFLLRFCYDGDDAEFTKKVTLGLATIWKVEYDRERWQQARYTSPWIGFGLELQTIPEVRGE